MIFDLDGVITQTAKIHAAAWQEVFDKFYQHYPGQLPEGFVPINITEDYPRYIDGMSRLDGVRNFLKSRNMKLKEGDAADPPGYETVHALGKQKNIIFQELLDKKGVKVYADAVQKIKAWKAEGVKTGLISSSKNTPRIIEKAGIKNLFDTVIDGNEAQKRQLNGKPAPDIFLEAAREISLPADRLVVFEDAEAGIAAGVAGNFKLVIGVARNGSGKNLEKEGAHKVISDFHEL